MAYIPPHRRNSKDTNTPSLTPSPYVLESQPQLQINSKVKKKDKGFIPGGYIAYAEGAITRWFVVPSDDDDDDEGDSRRPLSSRLKEYGFIDSKFGCKPMILVCDHHQHTEVHGTVNNYAKTPWVSITEKIKQDLLTSFQNARNEMCNDGIEPHVVLRFGKVLFRGIPSSMSLDNMNKGSVVETALSGFKRIFSSSIPKTFVDAISDEIIQKIGFEFDEETELFHVKVTDKFRQHSTILCICTVNEAVGELHLYKTELNVVRHLVVDVSCLDKNLDLRLLLYSKRILTSLTDDEKLSLSNVLKSAVIDSKVNGGLRWPLGKKFLGDRFTVVGVCHTKAINFKNSFLNLKLRYSDRFDFRTSIGEIVHEASLSMTELNRQLADLTLGLNPMTDLVQDALKLIWDHFLCWEGSFT